MLASFFGIRSDFPVHSDIKIIPVKSTDLQFNLFPNIKCINCGMYHRNYHCIPILYTRGQQIVSQYKNIRLLVITHNFENRIKDLSRINNKYTAAKYACNAEVQVMKSIFKKYLDTLRIWLRANKIDGMLFGYGGGCRSCKVCALQSKEQCRHKNEVYRSPESIGIDVYLTLQQLQVGFDIIPRQNVSLVGMILYGNNL